MKGILRLITYNDTNIKEEIKSKKFSLNELLGTFYEDYDKDIKVIEYLDLEDFYYFEIEKIKEDKYDKRIILYRKVKEISGERPQIAEYDEHTGNYYEKFIWKCDEVEMSSGGVERI